LPRGSWLRAVSVAGSAALSWLSICLQPPRNRRLIPFKRILHGLVLLSAVLAAPTWANDDGKWRASANLYAWVSDTDVGVTLPTGTETITIDALDAFKHVELTIMGGGTISRGRLGFAADLLYARLNANEQIELPGGDLDAELGFRASTLVVTLAPFYTIVDNDRFRLRGFAGARHLNLDQTVSFALSGKIGTLPIPDIAGSTSVVVSNWDGIVGLSAEWSPKARGLFFPALIDVGTGGSRLTWQYVVGVGYRFKRTDITLAYRDLRYELSGDITKLRLYGPAIGVAFRF
jgi:hypothetical protein